MLNEVIVKSVLNKTKRRDPWFLDDYTINPYSACSFNCLYCYIRGSKYGEHMEEKLSIKINALEILEKQLENRAKKKTTWDYCDGVGHRSLPPGRKKI